MPKGRRALANVSIVFAGFSSADQKQASNWIRSLGGHTSTNLNTHTTHVVCSEAVWKSDYNKVLEQAFEENERRKKNQINFVSYQWLGDCATDRSKKGEGPYRCERIYSSKKAKAQKASKSNGNGLQEPKSQKALVKDMLTEQTEKHLDERSRQDIEDAVRQKEKLEKIEEAARVEEEKAQRKKTADAFKRGAKKARNEIFTDNHHIYVDSTGFKHDVSLTKVDPRLNRNERYIITIQIYESNAEPYTYATNLNFAGTAHLAENNVLTAIGANFPTAFRSFKRAFKEYTRVNWDDRIIHAVRRAEISKNERTPRAGSDTGSKLGVPVASEFVREASKVKNFDEIPFQYHPPAYGPKGVLPREKQEELDRILCTKDPKRPGSEKIEAWIRKADGSVPQQCPEMRAPAQSKHNPCGEVAESSEGRVPQIQCANDGEIPVNSNGDYDFDAGLTVPIAEEVLHDLVDNTYPFEPNYSAQTYHNATQAFPGAENDGMGVDMPVDESMNVLFDTGANDFNNALFNTGVEGLPLDVFQTNFMGEEDDAATTKATQFMSFDLPTSTVAETTSFEPGTQDLGESMLADKVRAEMEEAMENIIPVVEAEQVRAVGGAVVTECNPATAEQALAGAEETLATIEQTPPKKLNLGSFMLGKRKAHEVLRDELLEENPGKKAK